MDLRQARRVPRHARVLSNQDEKIWQLRLVPAEPAPSTRLNLSVPTRRRHPATAKDRCFHSRTRTNEYWPLARDQGVIGLSQCNRRNRAKSPSVEQSVSLCSAASAATRSQAATMWAGLSARRPGLLVFKHIRNWSYAVCICHRTGRSVTKG